MLILHSTTILGMINRLQTVRREDRRADGHIPWDKFARFGEILEVISACQSRGPMVSGSPSASFRHALEDTPIITTEDVSSGRNRHTRLC